MVKGQSAFVSRVICLKKYTFHSDNLCTFISITESYVLRFTFQKTPNTSVRGKYH